MVILVVVAIVRKTYTSDNGGLSHCDASFRLIDVPPLGGWDRQWPPSIFLGPPSWRTFLHLVIC